MLHTQLLYNNPYPYPIPRIELSSHLRLDLPKGLFSVGLPVQIMKILLPSSILAT